MTIQFVLIVILLTAVHICGQLAVEVAKDKKDENPDSNHLYWFLMGKSLIFASNFFTLCTLIDLITNK